MATAFWLAKSHALKAIISITALQAANCSARSDLPSAQGFNSLMSSSAPISVSLGARFGALLLTGALIRSIASLHLLIRTKSFDVVLFFRILSGCIKSPLSTRLSVLSANLKNQRTKHIEVCVHC